MTPYLLDTDQVTLHQHDHPGVVQRLLQLGPHDVAVTIITVEEQIRGRLDIIRRTNTTPRQVQAYAALQATLHYFQRLPVVEFSQDAYDRFVDLRRQRIRIGAQDLRIAAIALTLGATLVTRNQRDFAQIPGLVIEDWANP